MASTEVSEVFSVKSARVAIDPDFPEYGQISFSHDGKGYTFVLPRKEFERLGRAINERLKAVQMPRRHRNKGDKAR